MNFFERQAGGEIQKKLEQFFISNVNPNWKQAYQTIF